MGMLKKLWTSLKLTGNYLKVMPQLIVGAWKIARLPQPVVSMFGGSNLKRNSRYVLLAEELARRLVAREISIITGGGPGIMEAGNCGAFRKDYHRVHTMAIAVRGVPDGVDGHPVNQCVKDYVMTDYFALRKYLLISYSYAYVVFPGGFGTMDEIAEVLTHMQTKKIPIAPLILIGEEYWSPFMAWAQRALAEGLVLPEHYKFITVTDDLDVAIEVLVTHCERCKTK